MRNSIPFHELPAEKINGREERKEGRKEGRRTRLFRRAAAAPFAIAIATLRSEMRGRSETAAPITALQRIDQDETVLTLHRNPI